MKRLERLTALLSVLQSRKYTPLQHLVERFDKTERTLYRDLDALKEAGVPLGFEKDKGYFILDRHFLPPLAFSTEEAKAFLFMEQLALKYLDTTTKMHFNSGMEKIRNKLRDTELAEIENTQTRVKAYIDPAYETRFLHLVEQACSQKLVLKLNYVDINGIQSLREVEPIGITFYSQAWHLIAYCRLRNAYRDFSLQRVKMLAPTGETYKNNLLTLNEYIQTLEKN